MRYSARQRAAFLAAALAVGATWAAPALAADEPKWATTLLEDDVVAVGVINLRQIDVPASVEAAQSLGIMGDAEAEQLLSGARVAQQRLAQLTQRGVERAYVLVRLADLTSGGSTWIVELASDADGAGAADLLKQQLEAARAGGGLHDLGGMLPRELQVVAGVVAGAPSQERLQQLREAHVAAVRDDARDALAALADVDVGFVVFGDADSRRVLRETFPQLPAPFRAIDGRLLADGVRWAAVTASLAGNPPTVTIETADAATAVALQDAAAQGVALLEALAQTAGEDANGPAAALREVAPLLRPTVDGTRLTLKLLDDEAELNALRTIVA
ncbi:MAG TPA: hypothetical protein PKC18_14585, partial [Lacipirellulaceae bacterium]|nr:hypothetical protein [Lacipirellulaceae bacterium]